jgi:AraC-like DNA-binding protein
MDADGTAKLMGWGARVLYLGPAFALSPHRNATGVLAVALDRSIEVSDDPACEDASYRSARSVLIMPNSLHHLRIDGGRMAFLYVDPFGQDLDGLRARMRDVGTRAAFDLIDEKDVIDALNAIVERHLPAEDASRTLNALLGFGLSGRPDSRIVEATRRIRDAPDQPHQLSELADRAGLSPSRFQHLFKAETGVPLRRYRIWSRMGAASRAIAAGCSLTDAAHGAGFSSSAHFSAAFRDMFGMMPSELFATLRRLH